MRFLAIALLAGAALLGAESASAQAAAKPDRQLVTAVKGQTIRGSVSAQGTLFITPESRYRVTEAKVTGPMMISYQGNEGIIVRSSGRGTKSGTAQFKLYLEDGRTVTVQVQLQAAKASKQSYLVIR
ncbi:hypothetical protein ACFSM5_17890 [Lacibacterium aquatile]|uniref:Uncharacterized protein n=1 Tax=Lacibacterium aquatile TaxID=1168082 RepID=A0ABW5DUM2_9PROT